MIVAIRHILDRMDQLNTFTTTTLVPLPRKSVSLSPTATTPWLTLQAAAISLSTVLTFKPTSWLANLT